MTHFNIILFDDFETLDAFGPAEMIGCVPDLYSLGYYSLNGGIVESSQKVRVETLPFSKIADEQRVLLVLGGEGTRNLVKNHIFLSEIKKMADKAEHVLSVCTGAAILATTGLLDGKRATSNKLAFNWVSSCGKDVNWIRRARWVTDGKFYTSSGVSAGMDMVLGFVRDQNREEAARNICKLSEYVWNSDKHNDPFA